MTASQRAQARNPDAGPQRVRLLKDVAGIHPELLRSMHKAGILSVESLLANANSPRLRMFLAERTGVAAREILDVLDMADLTRVPSISHEIALMLRSLGIRNASDLAEADPSAILELLRADEDMPEDDLLQLEGLLGILIAQARVLPSLHD